MLHLIHQIRDQVSQAEDIDLSSQLVPYIRRLNGRHEEAGRTARSATLAKFDPMGKCFAARGHSHGQLSHQRIEWLIAINFRQRWHSGRAERAQDCPKRPTKSAR